MNRYRLVFKLGNKRRTRTIEAKNYDHAESQANKAIRIYRRETGGNVELVTMERVYKTKSRSAEKPAEGKWRYGITDAIGNVLDFFAGMGY